MMLVSTVGSGDGVSDVLLVLQVLSRVNAGLEPESQPTRLTEVAEVGRLPFVKVRRESTAIY